MTFQACFERQLLARFDDTHACADCGEPYFERMGAYWLTPPDLWAQVVGDNTIVLCPPCFGRRANLAGVNFHWEAVRGV